MKTLQTLQICAKKFRKKLFCSKQNLTRDWGKMGYVSSLGSKNQGLQILI